MRKRVFAVAVLAALALAGGALAYGVGTVWLQPGSCSTIGKTRVCARRATPKTVTIPPVTIAATTVTATQTVTAPPPPPAIAFRDGTYRVGVDIQPGTYRALDASGCYWARLRGFSGNLGDIIANANYVGIVTISSSDVGFESSRCGGWEKVG